MLDLVCIAIEAREREIVFGRGAGVLQGDYVVNLKWQAVEPIWHPQYRTFPGTRHATDCPMCLIHGVGSIRLPRIPTRGEPRGPSRWMQKSQQMAHMPVISISRCRLVSGHPWLSARVHSIPSQSES